MARDSRWLIVFVIIVAVIATTSIMNMQKNTDITERIEHAINVEDDDLKIDWTHYQTANIKLSSSIDITKSGVYHLTGTLFDGSINVKLGEEGVAKLILDNVTINNSTGPSLAIRATTSLSSLRELIL